MSCTAKEHLLKLLNSTLFQWGGRAGQPGGISNTQPPSARLGFHNSPGPGCTQHVQSAGRNAGPSPKLRSELSPPGNSGPGAMQLQHVSWLVARPGSPNLTPAFPPSALALLIPWGQNDPRNQQVKTALEQLEALPYPTDKGTLFE